MGKKTANESPVLGADLLEQLSAALQPSRLDPATRSRMRERVLASTDSGFHVVRAGEGEWRGVLPGVAVKRLWLDPGTGMETSLWRLEASACIPAHAHVEDEQCLVIEGEIEQAGAHYAVGDYLHALAGSHHQPMRALQRSVLLIRALALPVLAARA